MSKDSTVNETSEAIPLLTSRQRTILDFIRDRVNEKGFPPSVREIGEAVGLTSTSSVAHQLRVLEEKGYLRRDPNTPRAMLVTDDAQPLPEEETEEPVNAAALPDSLVPVPLLGQIAAGAPILADENETETFPLPRELVGDGDLFLLRVKGDSMIDAAICDGDFVVIIVPMVLEVDPAVSLWTTFEAKPDDTDEVWTSMCHFSGGVRSAACAPAARL